MTQDITAVDPDTASVARRGRAKDHTQRLGNRVVGAGSGFYVPAGHTYGYRAGSDGVEILEIRSSTSFGMKVVEDNPVRWQEMVDFAVERQAEWAAFSADAGA